MRDEDGIWIYCHRALVCGETLLLGISCVFVFVFVHCLVYVRGKCKIFQGWGRWVGGWETEMEFGIHATEPFCLWGDFFIGLTTDTNIWVDKRFSVLGKQSIKEGSKKKKR